MPWNKGNVNLLREISLIILLEIREIMPIKENT